MGRYWIGLGAGLLALVLVMAFPELHGSAQDPGVVERPVLKVGDRWTYSWEDSRGSTGVSTWAVTRVGEFEGVHAYFIERTGETTTAQGQKRTWRDVQVRDTDLNWIARLDAQGDVVFRRRYTYMRWPLTVGAQWEAEGAYEFLDRRVWVKRRNKVLLQVRGMEDVATPAGTFKGARLYSIWRSFSEDGAPLGHGEAEDWLSAQVRFFVLGRWKEGTYSAEYQLVSYRLSQ